MRIAWTIFLDLYEITCDIQWVNGTFQYETVIKKKK